MKNTSQKLIIISFVLALITAILVFQYLQSLKLPKDAVKKTTVLVAKETIAPRTLIDKKMVKEIEVADDSIFTNCIKDKSQIIGKYTKETIYENQGFRSDNLLSENGDELALNLNSDHRAMSINVSGDAGVSDLIKAGDFVDVIVFLAEKKDGEKVIREDTSKIILQNIQVLAVDKQLNREDTSKDNEKVPTSFLVTLSVSTSDVEKLVLAESIGSLKLALRPIKSDGTKKTDGTTDKELTVSNSGGKATEVKETTNSGNTINYVNYTVKPGDTLKKISTAFYGVKEKYVLIKEANNIKNENLIVTGEVIKIPIENKG